MVVYKIVYDYLEVVNKSAVSRVEFLTGNTEKELVRKTDHIFLATESIGKKFIEEASIQIKSSTPEVDLGTVRFRYWEVIEHENV